MTQVATTDGKITGILQAVDRDSREALDELMPEVYSELKRMASR